MTYIWIPKCLLALATGFFVPVLVSQLQKFTKTKRQTTHAIGLSTAFALFFLKEGIVFTLLVIPWVLFTFYVALIGMVKLLNSLVGHRENILVSFGCLYLSVGGVWLLASSLNGAFLGFSEPWKTLTAVHFHFASFIFPVTCGLLLGSIEKSQPLPLPVRISNFLYIISVALIAIGLNGFRGIELAGVSLLNVSGISILIFILARKNILNHQNIFLTLGLAAGVVGLSLSFCYAWRIGPALSLDTMAVTHGIINATILIPTLLYFSLKNCSI